MNVLILAAGYATRLHPLTLNTPKPLITVGSKTIIDHTLSQLSAIHETSHIYVITNQQFYSHFDAWSRFAHTPHPITVINDGTNSNSERLGAVGDIMFALRRIGTANDLFIIAGDNLSTFSLKSFIAFFKEHGGFSVAVHNTHDIEIIRNRLGAVQMNGPRIIGFEEKPAHPKTTIASTACYLMHPSHQQDLLSSSGSSLDNLGDMVRRFVCAGTAYGYLFSEPWFDIGTIESLKQAARIFR